jgi:hypothetical protein
VNGVRHLCGGRVKLAWQKKCPQGELNPCFHLERVASLPLDHEGGIAGWHTAPNRLTGHIAVTGFEPVF